MSSILLATISNGSSTVAFPTGIKVSGNASGIIGQLVSSVTQSITTGGGNSSNTVTSSFNKVVAKSTFLITGMASIINMNGNSDIDGSLSLQLGGATAGQNWNIHLTGNSSTRLNVPFAFTVSPSTLPIGSTTISITTSVNIAHYYSNVQISEYQV